jgi:23S rRNA pseudouridine1911/1915/1917 synthase
MLVRLFENDRILAVNKPTGTPSVSLSHSRDKSMEDEVVREFPLAPPQLLHRLDTGTSGVLLFAKDPITFDEMRLKFKHRMIQKDYWAFVRAPAPLPRAFELPRVIRVPLGHHPKSKKRMIPLPEGLRRSIRGKPLPAETWIHQCQPGAFFEQDCLRLNIEITTGVMHQIRVHLAYIGMPILGDPLYGKPKEAPATLRLGLHARNIGFELGGFRYSIEAPIEGWRAKS